MHLVRGLAGLVERVHLRQRRVDPRLAHEPVRFPRLAVVREVAALQRLEVHPEVAVVVLDLEARRRRARDDHAAALGDEHRRAHRRAARVFEHDVDVAADRARGSSCRTAATRPGPARCRRRSRTCSPRPAGRSPLRSPSSRSSSARFSDDTTPTGVPPPFFTYCTAYAPMPPVAPHTSTDLALRHLRAVRAHDHAVARGVAQRVARRLFPREVRGLRHELVRLHDRDLGEAAEVGLEAPDALVRRHHRVVVRRRVLVVDVQAVHGDDGRPASSCAPPTRPAARHPTRRSPSRGTAGRGACPTRSRGRGASGSRTSGSGSKIDVHTVLKLMADAITPTNASSGASSGSGNCSTWVDLRGSLSSEATPANISTLVGLHERAPHGRRERQRLELGRRARR